MSATNKKPLTPRMREVLALMADGWEATREGGVFAGAGLQQGRIGYGGPSKPLLQHTLFGLIDRGYVKRYGGEIGSSHYRITESGRAALRPTDRSGP